jgi:hypothetical protein
MPSRSSTKKSKPKREGTEHDFTVVARRVVEQAIGERLDGSPLPDKDAGIADHVWSIEEIVQLIERAGQ